MSPLPEDPNIAAAKHLYVTPADSLDAMALAWTIDFDRDMRFLNEPYTVVQVTSGAGFAPSTSLFAHQHSDWSELSLHVDGQTGSSLRIPLSLRGTSMQSLRMLGLCDPSQAASLIEAGIKLGKIKPRRDPVIGFDAHGIPFSFIETAFFHKSGLNDAEAAIAALEMQAEDIQRVVEAIEQRLAVGWVPESCRFSFWDNFSAYAARVARLALHGAQFETGLWNRVMNPRGVNPSLFPCTDLLSAVLYKARLSRSTNAISNDVPALVEALLATGHDRRTLLHAACAKQDPELLRLVLNQGDVQALDDQGRTLEALIHRLEYGINFKEKPELLQILAAARAHQAAKEALEAMKGPFKEAPNVLLNTRA